LPVKYRKLLVGVLKALLRVKHLGLDREDIAEAKVHHHAALEAKAVLKLVLVDDVARQVGEVRPGLHTEADALGVRRGGRRRGQQGHRSREE
jgi:hypothetical protein